MTPSGAAALFRPMNLLDLTLPSPAENLALDEALLDAAESGGGGEVLRLWESPVHFVVLGAGCRAAEDVDLERCAAEGVPVLRRCSGGGTVLQGPGCLSYALVLEKAGRPEIGTIEGTNRFVLGTVARGLAAVARVRSEGISDLTANGRKVSGNAQRRRKDLVLFHGTLLYGMDLGLVSRYLREPAKQPEYRTGRSHSQFVDNLRAGAADLRAALAEAWAAKPSGRELPGRSRAPAGRSEVLPEFAGTCSSE